MTSKWPDYIDPSGRFSRGQFALSWLVGSLLSLTLIGVFIGVPLIIVAGIRRLHDLNLSGWYLLLGFIPFINLLGFLCLLLAPGRLRVPKKDGTRATAEKPIGKEHAPGYRAQKEKGLLQRLLEIFIVSGD